MKFTPVAATATYEALSLKDTKMDGAKAKVGRICSSRRPGAESYEVFEVVVRTPSRGNYVVYLDGERVGSLVQMAVGKYGLYLTGASPSHQGYYYGTLAENVERLVHITIENAVYQARLATPEGQAEKAAQEARAAEMQAAHERRRKDMAALLGHDWDYSTRLSPEDVDRILAAASVEA
jgi:hypothetical protein